MYHTTGKANVDPHETKDHVSNVLWIDFNEDDKDFYEDTLVENPTRMVYGFASKYKLGQDFFVRFHIDGSMNGQTNKFAPDYLWEQFDNQTTIPFGSRIGFDFHFSAFGHGNSIALYSGILDWYNNSQNAQVTPSKTNTNRVQIQYRGKWDSGGATIGGGTPLNLKRFTGNLRQCYIGANSPFINFNTQSSRFEISQLHSSEYIGNNESAGSNISINPVGSVDDSVNEVYKINKRSNFYNFCPDIHPYTMVYMGKDESNTAHAVSPIVSDISPFLDKYIPYDSHSGITIVDWGYNLVESADRFRKNTWEDGLWSKLGYLQSDLVYSGTPYTDADTNFNVRNVLTTPQLTTFPTTNAIVGMGDLPSYVKNAFGNSIMNYQLPCSSSLFGYDVLTPVIEPSINIVQNSSVFSATMFPKKMENGFFLIRSNIIPNTQYSGSKYGGTELNVVAVCNKENAESDFFFSESSQMEFTATKPFTISEITTSIHKPNQELADLDDNSCVIYKIQKNIMQQTDLISDILSRNK